MRIFRYDESVNIRHHQLAISCIFNCMCTAARTFIDGCRLHTVGLRQWFLTFFPPAPLFRGFHSLPPTIMKGQC